MSQKSKTKNAEHFSTIALTVGTAGHIDHGKTELVKYLTGCDCDCLPEEKQRGMTIDLGFATCELPDHRRVGIVDVPGHERFIHNMVAGAAGIDCVLLVVAADDGVMPQTVEHFHIVRMLGVTTGMVVITKTDLVAEGRVPEVVDQVNQMIAGSFLAGCPVVPFSSKTGEGFDVFHSAFVGVVDRTAAHNADGPFRLHVERSFVLKGLGTIVSGIPCSGRLKIGDSLELLPSGETKRVKGLQVYGKDDSEAQAGECVALRMGDVSKDEVGRGMVLAEPGFFLPAQYINARFQLLPHVEKPIKPRMAVRFHIGTTDVPGHLLLPDLNPLKPGAESYVQFQLKRPVVAAPGDFFVVRRLSPVTTIGGGYVVSPVTVKMRRKGDDWVKDCRDREKAMKEPASALTYVLQNVDPEPVPLARLAHMSFMNEAAVKKHLPSLLKSGLVIELPGNRYVHSDILRGAEGEVLEILNRLHDEKPISIGFTKKDVFRHLKVNRVLSDKALELLRESGVVMMSKEGLCVADRAPALSPKQAALAEKISRAVKQGGFASPRQDELAGLVGIPASLVDPVVDHLVQKGELVKLADNVILHKDCLEESRQKLVEYLEESGSIEAGTFRDMLATTRKYSIPILEYWDSQGLTKRTGNARVLRN